MIGSPPKLWGLINEDFLFSAFLCFVQQPKVKKRYRRHIFRILYAKNKQFPILCFCFYCWCCMQRKISRDEKSKTVFFTASSFPSFFFLKAAEFLPKAQINYHMIGLNGSS